MSVICFIFGVITDSLLFFDRALSGDFYMSWANNFLTLFLGEVLTEDYYGVSVNETCTVSDWSLDFKELLDILN